MAACIGDSHIAFGFGYPHLQDPVLVPFTDKLSQKRGRRVKRALPVKIVVDSHKLPSEIIFYHIIIIVQLKVVFLFCIYILTQKSIFFNMLIDLHAKK